MVTTSSLGYPRIGPQRELKWALEKHWSGQLDRDQLLQEAGRIRTENWRSQAESGLDWLPSGDFSLYDQVLDLAFSFGAIPERFQRALLDHPLDRYFLMARGQAPGSREGVHALEMTKWFDTNYHFLVPELEPGLAFSYQPSSLAEQFVAATALGHRTRPLLLGPVSFLLLSKDGSGKPASFEHLPSLLSAYQALLSHLVELGADWVELDEPCLALDLSPAARAAYRVAYRRLAECPARLFVASYFGRLGDNLDLCLELPVSGIGFDALAGAEEVKRAAGLLNGRILGLGLVDGRNVWRADLERSLTIAETALQQIEPDRLWISPTCSLLHLPIDLAHEEASLDPELLSWLSFARQKLDELALIKQGLERGRGSIAAELEASRAAREARLRSPRTRNPAVREALAAVRREDERRATPASERRSMQRKALGLPLLPTTTIGSFPQTAEVRQLRARFKSGALTAEAYRADLEAATADAIQLQERIGLDVLVHGEFERTDMVEYFGAKLDGMAVTLNGWVQSYGSRCVKPPILFGDVVRPAPMTVELSVFAQSKSSRPVKGMLTGPITLLKWSFVRDDEPYEHTARCLALALRAEIRDLEAGGISVIQVDEPAFREALPLRLYDRRAYLDWSVRAFRLATSGVRDSTQIHTHMCYSEFGEVIDAIRALDADVISIESARSSGELLRSFSESGYPNDIGLGVYDIHSPRVPSVRQMLEQLESALRVLDPGQVWVNPDCGLKTRNWEEVVPALENLVRAATAARAELQLATVPPTSLAW